MTLAQLAPTPVFKAFNNNGTPLQGGLLYTYAAGTSTPQATYPSQSEAIPNTNPVVLNARGECALWLDPTLSYKLNLTDSLGNQIPGYPVDNIVGPSIYISGFITQTTVGTALWPQTAAEIAAAVTPLNYFYPPLTVDRYGTNTTPGTTSMAAAFQSAINVGKAGGGVVTWGDGPYLIDAALDLTNPVGVQKSLFAMIGHGRFKAPTLSYGTSVTPSIILKHTGNAFDTTGSLGIHFENMSIMTDSATYPKTCFLLARNTDGSSRSDRIMNCYVAGLFSQTVLYNFAAEDGVYFGNQFYNYASDSNTSVFDITLNNIRSVTSAFTTIYSGSPTSCIDHKIFGGEYANLFQGVGTTADVFRFEQARFIKIYGPWLDCTAKAASSAGRSLVYIDGTNGGTAGVILDGVTGEATTFPAAYGILFDGNAKTHSNFRVIGCELPNGTNMLGGGATATLSQLIWLNNTNESSGGGIDFAGTMTAWQVDNTSGGVTGTPNSFNQTWSVNQGISVPGEANFFLEDTTQASGSKVTKLRSDAGGLAVSTCDDSGVSTALLLVIPKGTGAANSGWGTPTAGSVINNFAGSGATLAQCGSALTEIIALLKTVGLFTA